MGAGRDALPRPTPTPAETDLELAAADQDYATGRKAIVARQWEEAIARLRKAEGRHPDHADLQNDLGYAHRNLKQLDAAFRLLPCEELTDLEKAFAKYDR
jgi:Flp pilus assembly protein TadD